MSEKVLLVDDEKDFLDVMSERMSARGMDVSAATSAEEALKEIENASYDAIVLDLMMPGMDGIEALKKIKKVQPEAQVILLTGHATVEKSVEAIKLGALDFIEKPADIQTITEKIKEAHAQKVMIVNEQQQTKIKEILTRFGF